MTRREKNFLLKLASLVEQYGAEFWYTNDDDGIHISVDGKEVYVGFGAAYDAHPGSVLAKELREAAQ